MTDLYNKMAATAQRLLREKGQAMTLTRRTPGAYNPATSAATPGATTIAVVGVLMSLRQQDRVTLRTDDPESLLRGDRKAIISAQGVSEVAPGDTLTIGNELWSVVNADKLNPAGVTIIYTLQVRQ